METPWTTVESSATVLNLDPPVDLPPALVEPPLCLPLLSEDTESVSEEAVKTHKKQPLPMRKVQSLAITVLYVAPMTFLGGYAAYALPSAIAAPMATGLWVAGLVGATALAAFFSHTERFYRRLVKRLVERAYATASKDQEDKAVREIHTLQGSIQELLEKHASKELQMVTLKEAKAHLETKMSSLMQQIETLQAQEKNKQTQTEALLEEYRNLLGAKEQERKEQDENTRLLEQQVADLKYEVTMLLEVTRMDL